MEPTLYTDSAGDRWEIHPAALDLDGIDPDDVLSWLIEDPRNLAALLFSGCRDAAASRRLDAGDFLLRILDDHDAQCRALLATVLALRLRFQDCEPVALAAELMSAAVVATCSLKSRKEK